MDGGGSRDDDGLEMGDLKNFENLVNGMTMPGTL